MTCLVLQDGHTALMFAAEKGHCETAEVLVRAGADVNAKIKVYPIFACIRDCACL